MGKLIQDFSNGTSGGLSNILLPGFILPDLSTKQSMAANAAAKTPDSLPPTLITPTAMPSSDGPDAMAAKRKAMAQQLARGGRASTILTNPDSLG